MFLVIFVFLLVVFFKILPSYSNWLSNKISREIFKLTDEELNLRAQAKDLKTEQESVSMADEFAKYMKLQRRIDKNLAEIKALGNPRQQNINYVKLGVKIGINVLHAITMLSIVIYYRAEPLVNFPSDWFIPFSRLVAMPTGISGGVGIGCWVLICNTALHRVKQMSYLLEG
ncbi:hypothetical protein LOTGIDRAFT_119246 [Lottia gigantea]|uniref:Guided entry of tail-anchored proteins factor 1 n=1 Tax=Lottia gigantea TaxID=225164 RepID=V4BX20_LOTGI|nr:hypothetical protein LOTGIDRAFT_119246 [Lottia gigantea]ESO93599.1 hypothetical protein LOTGIDRAFT_119246 [Lottia gigantea]